MSRNKSPVSRLCRLFEDLTNNRSTLELIFMIYVLILAVYIFLPILSLILFSFNESGLVFPISGFTLEHYHVLFDDTELISSVWRSIQLATVTGFISTILATGTAIEYLRGFRYRRPVFLLLIGGIIVPGIMLSIGSNLVIIELLGVGRGPWTALSVHIIWTTPFAVIILLAGFPRSLPNQEEAAKVMGFDDWEVAREIIIPQIAPTILGAFIFSFTLSYNESTRSLLLLGTENTIRMRFGYCSFLNYCIADYDKNRFLL